MSDAPNTNTTATAEGEVQAPSTGDSTPATATTATPSTEGAPQEQEQPKATDETLNEGGKKALEAERTKNSELTAELAKLREGTVAKADHDKLVEERDALTKRVAEYEAKETKATQTQSVVDAAAAAGARNPRLVARLVDLSQLSDTTSAADLVAAVKADADTADLFGDVQPTPKKGVGTEAATEGSNKPPTRKHFTVEQINEMSDVEYRENREAILDWQSRNTSQ